MKIRFVAMLGWVVPISLAVGGLGAYPTWYWCGQENGGWEALEAETWAWGIVFIGIIMSGLLIHRAAREGAARAAAMFMPTEGYRIALCVILGVVAWLLTRVHFVPLVVWLFIFYLTMLFCEVAWLARALRRSVITDALEKLGRARRFRSIRRQREDDRC
jgi:hypothetical protein